MFNFGLIEFEMMEAIDRSHRPDTELEAFLAQLAEEKRGQGLRRRFAGLAMRLALKLDPEAIAVAPRLRSLEAANVRG